MTVKYKIGDRIRRIKEGGRAGMKIGDIAEVVKVSGWPCTMYGGRAIAHNPAYVELVTSAPTGFEVGKKYYIAASVVLTCIHQDGDNFFFKGAFPYPADKLFSVIHHKNMFKMAKEYIPPPPEEWRAVFYVKNGKPEISAAYSSSKEDVEYAWKGNSTFMYAIRTDEGVLKNG
jgi:hypothetical protein